MRRDASGDLEIVAVMIGGHCPQTSGYAVCKNLGLRELVWAEFEVKSAKTSVDSDFLSLVRFSDFR